MRLPPAEIGPKVDVTVPLVAPVNATTCLEQVDRTDQCTSTIRDLVQIFTYHGAVHVEDARVPVLLQTEGRYEIRGSVFSIRVAI
jgi:hypothetical protein